jgi:hypothetical protein
MHSSGLTTAHIMEKVASAVESTSLELSVSPFNCSYSTDHDIWRSHCGWTSVISDDSPYPALLTPSGVRLKILCTESPFREKERKLMFSATLFFFSQVCVVILHYKIFSYNYSFAEFCRRCNCLTLWLQIRMNVQVPFCPVFSDIQMALIF